MGLLFSGILLLSHDSGAQEDDWIVIMNLFERIGDLPAAPGPWAFEVSVTVAPGTVTDVEVTPPVGPSFALTSGSPGGDEWNFKDSGFDALDDLRLVYPTGDYTFMFNTGSDSVTLTYDPPEPTGSPNVTFPQHMATDAPYESLTFTWDPCASCGDAFVISLLDLAAEEDLFFDILDPNTTSWAVPTPLDPNQLYEVELQIAASAAGPALSFERTTTGGHAFEYFPIVLSSQEVWFRTASDPNADSDGDGHIDTLDNCPHVQNFDQIDTDTNGIGDACQCGDVNGDGYTNITDALIIARGLVASGSEAERFGDVNGDTFCNVTDALIIARGQQGSAHEDQHCPAYHGL